MISPLTSFGEAIWGRLQMGGQLIVKRMLFVPADLAWTKAAAVRFDIQSLLRPTCRTA